MSAGRPVIAENEGAAARAPLVGAVDAPREEGSGTAEPLSGGRAERECDVSPRRPVGCRARQMQDEAANGADDMGAQLEQPGPQPAHLSAGARRAGGPQPQFLHEHVEAAAVNSTRS